MEISDITDIIMCGLTAIMCGLTAFYAVTTIKICNHNKKSADAARDQLAEMNKPKLVIHFRTLRREDMYFEISNVGGGAARNLKIDINKDFLDLIEDSSIRSSIEKLKEANLYLGAGQTIYLRLGKDDGNRMKFKTLCKRPAKLNLACDNYLEKVEIDLSVYEALSAYNSSLDDVSNNLYKISKKLR